MTAASPAGGALAAATHSPARTAPAVVLGAGCVITEPAVAPAARPDLTGHRAGRSPTG